MSEALVRQLLAAREHHRPILPPSETGALSLAEAYAVQDRLREALVARGERVVGWKAGFTNHLGARGLGLRAGDLVMSGSVSQLLRPKAGDTVRATFTRLGSVSVRFA